jgi:hypothetical protein
MSDARDKDEPEAQADEHERREAEALAAALDGKPHASDAPEDALATALLMRHGGTRAELSAERSEAILGELLRDLPDAAAPEQPSTDAPPRSAGAMLQKKTAVPAGRNAQVVRLRRLRPWGAAVLAAAAALLVVWRATHSDRTQELARPATPPGQLAAQPLPRASVQLLAAQSELLRAGLQRTQTGAAGQGGSDAVPPRSAGAVPLTEAEAAARFERELRAYRADLLRALRSNYPDKVGWLEPSARRPR